MVTMKMVTIFLWLSLESRLLFLLCLVFGSSHIPASDGEHHSSPNDIPIARAVLIR